MSDKFKYEKQMIGYLLKHYYKESNYSLEEFINGNDTYLNTMCNQCNKCNKPDRICSKNTLYRLFDGSIISNECVYYRLANKLNKEVILDRYDIYEKLEDYRELLVNNIVDFSKNNLEKLEFLISIEIKKYQNVLYVHEILSLYLNVIKDKLYPGYNPSKENVQTYIFLKDKIDEKDRKIILYYFYTGMFRRGDFGIDLNLIYQESKLYFDDSLLYNIKLDSIYELNLLQAYNYLTTNELPRYNSLSSYNKYLLLNSLSNLQVNLESYNEAYDSIIKCYKIVVNSDFSTMVYFGCYLRLGFVSYCLKKYDEASIWLLKAFKIRNNLAKDFVMLFQSLEKIGDIHKLKEILNKTDINLSKAPYGNKVYLYYKLKHKNLKKDKRDIIELENYICDILKPYFDTYGQIHKDAFNDDLKEYVKITGNYKKYYDFNNS